MESVGTGGVVSPASPLDRESDRRWLVRAAGDWELTTPTDRIPIDLAEYLAHRLGPAGRPSPTTLRAFATDATVVPISAVAWREHEHGWARTDPEGEPCWITAADIGLLDAVRQPVSVEALLSDTEQPELEVLSSIQRLEAAGGLRIETVDAGHAAEKPDPGVEPEPADADADGEGDADGDGSDVTVTPGAHGAPRASLAERVRFAFEHSSKIAAVRRLLRHCDRSNRAAAPIRPGDEPTPVFLLWPTGDRPPLSLGAIAAALKAHDGGRLAARFRIHRLARHDEVLRQLPEHGAAIVLFTHYLWSTEHNIDAAASYREKNPDVLLVHGGPNIPDDPATLRSFLTDKPEIFDVIVHGEGEDTAVELFDALDARNAAEWAAALDGIVGLSYVHEGRVHNNGPRARSADLNRHPSPYLSGEFDHIDADEFRAGVVIETNRGCPYGCTFCDWGSATMSRLRKFDLDRVFAELDWAMGHGIGDVLFADANFGIIARDVEIAEHIAGLAERCGRPFVVWVTVAKNTTKHLVRIFEVLHTAGVAGMTSLAVQSWDNEVLEAVERSNISPNVYVEVAASLRRLGMPLIGDLMIGLPRQSVASYRADLQFMFDHEVTARSWPTLALVNSPLNRPEYRDRYRLRIRRPGLVVASDSFSEADFGEMIDLRRMFALMDQYGLGRLVLQYLQWDHGIAATDMVAAAVDAVKTRPDDVASLAWLVHHFERSGVSPGGWAGVVDDLCRLAIEDMGVAESSDFDSIVRAQTFILAVPSRRLPARLTLDHDVVSYVLDAVAPLDESGAYRRPARRLAEYGPGDITVVSDPLGRCIDSLPPIEISDDLATTGQFFTEIDFDLVHPLMRNSLGMVRRGIVNRPSATAGGRREVVVAG